MTNKPRFTLYGLYVITPCSSIQPLSTAELLTKVQCALEGGARIVQYREKQLPVAQRREQALAIKALCERYPACFLINDDVTLAADVGAQGVHLGQGDAPLRRARAVLGESAIIGVSCYNQLELARTAQAGGADYVAFGRFFSSLTKPAAVPADLELLTRAKSELSLPIACIGGITADNAKLLIAAGAAMLAVVNAVFGAADVKSAARQLTGGFESGK
ncbi:MAG TPA: thiamine phosphate synthase [Gammaproteobacteria bacterium]